MMRNSLSLSQQRSRLTLNLGPSLLVQRTAICRLESCTNHLQNLHCTRERLGTVPMLVHVLILATMSRWYNTTTNQQKGEVPELDPSAFLFRLSPSLSGLGLRRLRGGLLIQEDRVQSGRKRKARDLNFAMLIILEKGIP